MTGIERLQGMSMAFRGYTWGASLYEALADIADQIEWERDAEVADSPYDAILPEDREAAAWVRDHGGIDHVRVEWYSRSNLKRMYEKEKAKVERQQRHIEFVQGKCRERQGHIVELSKELAGLRKVLSNYRDALGGMCERLGITDGTSLLEMPDVICEALDRRLMPEGYEWPRYEGGPLLRYDDSYIGNDDDNHRAWQIRFDSNADVHVSRGGDGDGFDRTTWDHFSKGERVKRPAVLAADGEPLEVGQFPPDKLTHTKPEPDSWERLEEDAKKGSCDYFGCDANGCHGCPAYGWNVTRGGNGCGNAKMADLMRRAKKLAERDA